MTEAERLEIIEKRKERWNAYHREWQRKNPDKVRAINERYIVRKAQKIQEREGH